MSISAVETHPGKPPVLTEKATDGTNPAVHGDGYRGLSGRTGRLSPEEDPFWGEYRGGARGQNVGRNDFFVQSHGSAKPRDPACARSNRIEPKESSHSSRAVEAQAKATIRLARVPWFRCFPAEILSEVAGMPPDAGYVYLVVYMRIFEAGGPTSDDARVIARRTGLSPRRARAAFEWLLRYGKIQSIESGYDIPTTHVEFAWRKEKITDPVQTAARARRKTSMTQQDDPTDTDTEIETDTHSDQKKSLSLSATSKSAAPTSESQPAELRSPKRQNRDSEKSRPKKQPLPNEADFDQAYADEATKAGIPHTLHRTEFRRFLNHYEAKAPESYSWRASWKKWVRDDQTKSRINRNTPPYQRKFASAAQIRTYD